MANVRTGQLLECPRAGIAPPVGDQTDSQLLERFARRQDEAAFATLVQRYGSMVLRVCRSVLKNVHEAEDAFQATFLVLVRKAGSLRRPELLGSWLYGVAYRIAVKARVRSAKRCEHERKAAAMPVPKTPCAETRQELSELLDAEMNRLPEKYRAPLVICYLHGKTNEEAARQLGWPGGSISYRLARGRELLRKRLTRRGVMFTSGLLTTQLAQYTATAAVPVELVNATVKAAAWFAAGKAASAGMVSALVVELAEEMLQTMLATKVRSVAAMVLFGLASLLLIGIVAHSVLAGGFQASPPTQGCGP